MASVRERCAAIFADVLEVDAARIEDDSSPDTLEEWDSLKHVQLILELEKEFGVTIAPDEGIEYENFKMVCDAMEQKLADKETVGA